MKRLAAAVAIVMALTVSGCGGSPTDDYCGALKKDQTRISDMLNSPSALVSDVGFLQDLADQSPDDLSDEWQTFLNAVKGLRDALKDAGVKPSEFKDDKPPAGLSVARTKAISDAADQLGAAPVVAAATGIEQQARDVCKINLGL